MMLYSNTKVKVRSPDGETDFFDLVAEVLQGDILTQYLSIKVRKVGDRSQGRPEGSFFNSYYSEV